MRVLIIEPHSSGHHASYLRWLAQAAARRGWAVVIASTREALSHPSLITAVSDLANIEVYAIAGSAGDGSEVGASSNLIGRQFRYWWMFRRIVEEVCEKQRVDAVILPYVDYCFYAIAMLGAPFNGLPWCGISMRLAVTRDSGSAAANFPLNWRLAKRILSRPTLKSLFVINPSVSDVPARWFAPKLRSKLQYLPDPAEFATATSKATARSALAVPEAAFAILIFGTIDERKGLGALIAALDACDELTDCVVILAGKQSMSMKDQLRHAPYARFLSARRLIVMDKFLDDAEQSLVFSAADLVWVGYRHHLYMSGVMVLAGKAALPLVGSRQGEIGYLIEKNGLGAAVDIDRPDEVAKALLSLFNREERLRAGARAAQTFAAHTVENFGSRVLDSLMVSL